MDGFFNTDIGIESSSQGDLCRHRLLRVNISTAITGDASGLCSSLPNGNANLQAGPHFILSPLTPDNRPTLGFEFALFSDMLDNGLSFPAGGVTVTIWALIGTLTDTQGGGANSMWAKFAAINGVKAGELLHSFDTNAGAIRFQITNTANDSASASVLIAFCEL